MIMCIVGGCPCGTVWNDVHTSLRSLKPEMNNSEKLTWALVVIRGFKRFFKEKTHTNKITNQKQFRYELFKSIYFVYLCEHLKYN